MLDAELTGRLLARGLGSADPGIREAGEDFENSARGLCVPIDNINETSYSEPSPLDASVPCNCCLAQ
jgi:hypothetical protein